jgi:ABC-type Fe3+/spermidine/putrescine transport system ATPase subunit
VAEFIGESNLLEGRLEPADGGAVFVHRGGVRVRVAHAPRTGGPYTLMVRPEKVAIAPAGPADDGVPGKVEEAIYVGEFTRYQVRVAPDILMTVKVPNTHAVYRAKPDDAVRVHWAVDDGYLVPTSTPQPEAGRHE